MPLADLDLGDQRLDPPEELYHATSEQREDADEQDRVNMEGEEKGEKPVLVLQKIHVFGIDFFLFDFVLSFCARFSTVY